MKRMYLLIWSFEHRRWWAPNRSGYVDDANIAGHYELAEAIKILDGANIHEVKEAMVPLNPQWEDYSPSKPMPMGTV